MRNCSWGATGDREPRRRGWGGRRAWGSQGTPARGAGGRPGRWLRRKARRGGWLLPTRDEGLKAEGGLARGKQAFTAADAAPVSSARRVAHTAGLGGALSFTPLRDTSAKNPEVLPYSQPQPSGTATPDHRGVQLYTSTSAHAFS